MLIGAGVGAGTALLSGNDWKTGAAVGAGTGGIGSQLTSNPFTTEALKSGVTNQASNSMMTTLAEQGATNAVNPTLAGLQQEILSEVPQSAISGVNDSVMQNPDFIGSHLTDDFNSQMLTNNTAGTYTDGIIDPLQSYPSFDNPVSSTAEELAMADGGYGGGILDSLGEGVGGITDSLSEFTGMDRGDVSALTLSQGANLLQPTPPEKIQHAPVGQGISKPNVDLTKTAGSPMTSLPSATTSAYPGQQPITDVSQLTPEQIMKLKQQGIL